MNQYTMLRRNAGLSCRALSKRMKPQYPKISAAAVSLAESPEQSGVMFTPQAGREIEALCAPERPARRDNRADRGRLSAHVPEALKALFNTSRDYRGYRTDKDYIVWLVVEDAKRIEEEKRIATRPNEVGLPRKRNDGQAGGCPQGAPGESAGFVGERRSSGAGGCPANSRTELSGACDDEAAATAGTVDDGKPNKPMASITAGKENVK